MLSERLHMLTHTPRRIATQRKAYMDIGARPTVTPEELDALVQHLGHFSLKMLTTFMQHQDEIPEPAASEFRNHIVNWTAVASEYIDMDPVIAAAVDGEV